MLPFITANNILMKISRTYATKETTSRLQAALCWVLTIANGLRFIPDSSSPLEHIHHVLCQVMQFLQASTGRYVSWLQTGAAYSATEYNNMHLKSNIHFIIIRVQWTIVHKLDCII